MDNKYTERQLVDGSISRKYDDGTYLIYEKWDTKNVYIKLLHSQNPGRGIARKHLLNFINQKRNKNLYTFVSDELGADLTLLKKFYTKVGFKPVKSHRINNQRVNYYMKAETK